MPGTLNTAELVTDIIDAFRVQFPMFRNMGTDFATGVAKFNQQVIARVAKVPTAADYHATTGYKNGAQSANDIVEDVAVTLNQHKHIPIKIDFIDQISTRRDLYDDSIRNVGYALGKTFLDYILGLAVAANITEETTESIANTDRDTLGTVRKAMNAKGAMPFGRFGIVNSDFFEKLEQDQRIASADYYGQRTGANAYGRLSNLVGFQDIYEYPDLPANSENMSAVFADPRCFVLAAGLPSDAGTIAQRYGIPQVMAQEVISDPDSGMQFLLFKWQEAGTGDLYMSLVLLFGAVCGAQGGSAGDKTDYAGHRVVTA